MTSTKISIVCAKPLPAAVEPQAVKKQAVMADGVCRTDGAAVDLKGGVLELLNSERPTTNRKPTHAVTPALAAPDANAGVTVGGPRSNHRVAAAHADRTPGADPTPTANDDAASVTPTVAEPSMTVTGNDVVVTAPDGRQVPEDSLSAPDKAALATVRATPDSSGDAILTPDKPGLVTAMDAVLAANPDLVRNAAANNIDKAQLANILADTLWPTGTKSDDGRVAISLPTYPGAYARMLQDYLTARASGDPSGRPPTAIMGAADAVSQTGIEALIAQDVPPGEARSQFFQSAVTANDENAAFYNRPEVRAALVDPGAAERFTPSSQWSPEQRRAFADGVDRGYRAAGYDPTDEEPLWQDSSAEVAPVDEPEANLFTGQVHEAQSYAQRLAARREEAQAAAQARRANVEVAGIEQTRRRGRVADAQRYLAVAERNLPPGHPIHALIRTV